MGSLGGRSTASYGGNFRLGCASPLLISLGSPLIFTKRLSLTINDMLVQVVDYVNQREWLIDVTPKPSSRTVVVTEEYNSILPNGGLDVPYLLDANCLIFVLDNI